MKPALVSAIEAILAQAQAGEIVGIALTTVGPDGEVRCVWAGSLPGFRVRLVPGRPLDDDGREQVVRGRPT